MEKQTVQEEYLDYWTRMNNRNVYLVNKGEEDFEWRWDGQEYFVPAGEKIIVPVWMVKHLIGDWDEDNESRRNFDADRVVSRWNGLTKELTWKELPNKKEIRKPTRKYEEASDRVPDQNKEFEDLEEIQGIGAVV